MRNRMPSLRAWYFFNHARNAAGDLKDTVSMPSPAAFGSPMIVNPDPGFQTAGLRLRRGQGAWKPGAFLDNQPRRPVPVGLALEPVEIVQAPVVERRDGRYGGLAESPLFGGRTHQFEYFGGFRF